MRYYLLLLCIASYITWWCCVTKRVVLYSKLLSTSSVDGMSQTLGNKRINTEKCSVSISDNQIETFLVWVADEGATTLQYTGLKEQCQTTKPFLLSSEFRFSGNTTRLGCHGRTFVQAYFYQMWGQGARTSLSYANFVKSHHQQQCAVIYALRH